MFQVKSKNQLTVLYMILLILILTSCSKKSTVSKLELRERELKEKKMASSISDREALSECIDMLSVAEKGWASTSDSLFFARDSMQMQRVLFKRKIISRTITAGMAGVILGFLIK